MIDVIGDSPAVYDCLTVPLFQANAATGTMSDGGAGNAQLNDNHIGTPVTADAVGEYCEVDFGSAYMLKQWRMYDSAMNNSEAVWKIQYWSGANWIDWKTNIPTSGNSGWTSWETVSIVETNKIRFVCTTVDTQGNSWCLELEMKY